MQIMCLFTIGIVIAIVVVLTILFYALGQGCRQSNPSSSNIEAKGQGCGARMEEGFDVSPVYYCHNCKDKTFGQCTQCLSCRWIKTINQDVNGKVYYEGKCVGGDEHGLYNPEEIMMDDSVQMIYPYNRDPFYNGEYISIF